MRFYRSWFAGARRKLGWVVTATTVAMLATLVPVGLASGQTGPVGTFVPPDLGILRLHYGSQDFFRYEPKSGPTIEQTITETRCEVSLVPSTTAPGSATAPTPGVAVDVFPGSGSHRVGTFGDQMGVRSGGSRGVDCSRVSGSEALHVGLDGALAAYEISRAALDVEVKQSALLKLETFFDRTTNPTPIDVFYMCTGDSIQTRLECQGAKEPSTTTPWHAEVSKAAPAAICRQRSDSGPDSGANDNCRLDVRPSSPFDEMRLTAVVGEISLEGGADGTPQAPGVPGGLDSVFFITDISGLLRCGESLTLTLDGGDGATENTVFRDKNVTAGNGFDPACPEAIPVLLRACTAVERGTNKQCLVLDKDTLGQNVQVRWTTVWAPEDAPSGGALQIPPTYVKEPGDQDPVPMPWSNLVTPASGSNAGFNFVCEPQEGRFWGMVEQSAQPVVSPPLSELTNQIQVTDTSCGSGDPFKFR